MAKSTRDRAVAEDGLRSIERLISEGDRELASVALELLEDAFARHADAGQAARMQAIRGRLQHACTMRATLADDGAEEAASRGGFYR